ncbi:DUF2147 domain-containing protein [Sphingobacteriaceae bacterium WQ 2009]|uniref:DUF2147 domain-containing protein n=1 Tax=Rhinopithecimicrobium faecis TaxID=2820698 RepID=A0A8T4H5C0_9SPHI|nr:DUF2147 domain-containing protein [Sphingobacteriaceae bacterium WQ 2009]
MKALFTSLLTLLITASIFAQTDPIIGKWQNPSGEGRVEITKRADKYYGKLYWLKEPNNEKGQLKKDFRNPDKNLQSRTIQGLEILTDFNKTGKNLYEGGKIYDPKTGKTYSSKLTLKDANRLDVRGFVGISLMGRTETWKRIE